jgi:hypothetical protein
MLQENVERRLGAAGRLIEHSETPGLGNAAKSSYYRSAIILLCTIVEGLAYELAKKHTTAPKHIIGRTTKYIDKHSIPSGALGTSGNLTICDKIKIDFGIDDDEATFAKLNIFLKNENVVPLSIYNSLNWTRIERNKLHFHRLNTPDTGYTRAKIERISRLILTMYRRL